MVSPEPKKSSVPVLLLLLLHNRAKVEIVDSGVR